MTLGNARFVRISKEMDHWIVPGSDPAWCLGKREIQVVPGSGMEVC
jgi:hypothetical protein